MPGKPHIRPSSPASNIRSVPGVGFSTSESTVAGDEGLPGGGDAAAEAPEVFSKMQHPILSVVRGDELTPHEACWASLMDQANRNLTLPGLSDEDALAMREMAESCRLAAALPPQRSQQANAAS